MTHRMKRRRMTRWSAAGQVLGGTTAMGAGIALLLHARLGLLPLDVLHSAISSRLNWTIGQTAIAVQVVFLLFYPLLRIRWGPGTFAAVLIPGIVCDAGVVVIPEPGNIVVRIAFFAAGAAAFVFGVALYLGANSGALPRDGVIADLAERWRWSTGKVRIAFDLASLIVGAVLLGLTTALETGVVGVASALLAVFLGPSIARLLPLVTLAKN